VHGALKVPVVVKSVEPLAIVVPTSTGDPEETPPTTTTAFNVVIIPGAEIVQTKSVDVDEITVQLIDPPDPLVSVTTLLEVVSENPVPFISR
jgi:hypothetical protein